VARAAGAVVMGVDARESGRVSADRAERENRNEDSMSHDYTVPAPR
jgi:hypothetical protein